jgi:hypothetical protein
MTNEIIDRWYEDFEKTGEDEVARPHGLGSKRRNGNAMKKHRPNSSP